LKVNVNRDSINKLLTVKESLHSNSTTISEIGPLQHVAKLVNSDIDKVVNILILIIVFVFDPLAIVMLILGLEIMNIKKSNSVGRENTKIVTPDNDLIQYHDDFTESLEEKNNIDEVDTTSTEPTDDNIDRLIDKTFKLTPEKLKNMPHELTRKIELKNNSV
jgi:hypothetical protein